MNNINIQHATIENYPLIQNMARFYVYDLSKECGQNSPDWALPENGLYESFDFKCYFKDATRKAYLIKVDNEIAGFALLNQETVENDSKWNMGEFFIIARFQQKGIGQKVAHKIFSLHPNIWEISVIPENQKALSFWEKTINFYTNNTFRKEIKRITYDIDQPERLVFIFDSRS